jgi:hypothetical protein
MIFGLSWALSATKAANGVLLEKFLSPGCCYRHLFHPRFPELPRRHRLGILPKPDTATSRSLLSPAIDNPIACRLLALILLVVPRHPSLDLFKVSVSAVRRDDLTHDAPIAVPFVPLDGDLLAEGEGG